MVKFTQNIILISCLAIMCTCCQRGLEGCIDYNACNYDETASVNNGSCIYDDEISDCNGNCKKNYDCIGECDGEAIIGNCGICCGGNTGIECFNEDDCPECIEGFSLGCFGCQDSLIEYDCNNICNGSAIIDDCGQCVGDLTNEFTEIIDFPPEWNGHNCHYYDLELGR